MAIVIIQGEVAQRIQGLALKHNRSVDEQVELMVETFETMDIQRVSFLPSPKGGHSVPVVEVSQPVIQKG